LCLETVRNELWTEQPGRPSSALSKWFELLRAWMFCADRVERVVGEYIQGAPIGSAKEDIVWPLRYIDSVEQFARRRIDDDLTGSEIDVAVRILS
jgi:hypothetical protein